MTEWLRPAETSMTFEEILVYQLWSWGPVRTIGRPGEVLPPAGGIREYVSNDRWRECVRELADSAQMIVIIAGRTPGLAEEIELIAAAGYLGLRFRIATRNAFGR